MPQPFPDDRSLRWYDHAILDRPEIAARIGLVATEWAAFERLLAQMFAVTLFGMGAPEGAGEAISQQALGALESLSARLDIISAILKPRIPEELYERFQETVMPDIRGRARERNRVIHGHWLICDDYPNDLIYAPWGKRRLRYTTKDFDDIAARINETSGRFIEFLMAVRIVLQQRATPHTPPPSPRNAQ